MIQPIGCILISYLAIVVIAKTSLNALGITSAPAPSKEYSSSFYRHKRRCECLESALILVRTHRIENAAIPSDWLEIALNGTDFEFSIMVVTCVWGHYGKEFVEYRLVQLRNEPDLYWDVVDFVKAQKHEA